MPSDTRQEFVRNYLLIGVPIIAFLLHIFFYNCFSDNIKLSQSMMGIWASAVLVWQKAYIKQYIKGKIHCDDFMFFVVLCSTIVDVLIVLPLFTNDFNAILGLNWQNPVMYIFVFALASTVFGTLMDAIEDFAFK